MRVLLIGLAIVYAMAHDQEQRIPRAQALDGFNYRRADFAKREKIANMNELAYDRTLEKFAELELAKYTSCPLPKVITVGNIEILPPGDFELYREHLSDPGRTRVALVKSPCKPDDPRESEMAIVWDTNDVLMLNGEAGSRCPESRPFVNNGLCGVRKGSVRKYNL